MAAKKLQVHTAVEGSNASILAYGQTSSGKTHSVTGIDLRWTVPWDAIFF